MRVGLWDDPNNGSEQWGDDYSITLQDGYFQVILGSDTLNHPLNSELFAGPPLHVQVSVDSVGLTQRTPLTTVPYAAHAASVDQGVPVGTILPFAGDAASLDANWVVCNGATVTDPGAGLLDFSPAPGVQVPNLTDNRFLMGVAAGAVGVTGGRNDLPTDGSHTHSFGQTSSDLAPDASHFTSGSFTNAAGGHNHGGDNRPVFLGVQYIVRVR